MHRRPRNRGRGGLLMLVAVALTALLVPALGRAGDTAPIAANAGSPDQVAALSGSDPITDGGAVTSITPAQAYAEATDPGATLQVDGGLTLQQAVGLQSASVMTSVPVSCWRWIPSVQWGTWPYQQKVHNDVTWCAAFGDHITSWSTHVSLGASLCDPTGPYGYKQVGGVGSGVVRLRAGGYFACPTTLPWLTYHYNRWFDTSFYTRGSAAIVATG
jgi:hypothetical protein